MAGGEIMSLKPADLAKPASLYNGFLSPNALTHCQIIGSVTGCHGSGMMDRHCRYFLRLLSPHARLYTEMVTATPFRPDRVASAERV